MSNLDNDSANNDPQRTTSYFEDSPLHGCEIEVDELRDCGRLFHQRGWSVGTSSNYSAIVNRDPLELAITASGMDKGRLERGDFVRLDGTGAPVAPNQPKSSAETMLHVVLAQELPKVGSVLHTHSVWGTLLSDHFFAKGGFEIAGYEMLKGLEGIKTHDTSIWVDIYENTQDIPQLAEQMRARLRDTSNPLRYGFLIRNHGLYTWGDNVQQARRHIEIFEFLFECVGRKLSMPV